MLQDNLPWWLGGAIILFGLLVYGFSDLLRLSLRRAWAISSVCFAESIRRRVLLITPLAIIGIILISQLQRPIDEADAIRQTIKVAMFATGLIVCVLMIILACTNLPKEIDTRVIYTVVTKPTTRLEIVLGKIIGFARVSAAILIIMGLFTWGYLELRQWNLLRLVAARLQGGDVALVHRGTLEHYLEKGLLASKDYARPTDLQVYSSLPTHNGKIRWVFGKREQNILIPFSVSADELSAGEGGGGLIMAHIQVRQRRLTPEERQQTPDPLSYLGAESVDDGVGPINPHWKPKPIDAPPAKVAFQILTTDETPVIDAEKIDNGKLFSVPPADSGQPIQVPLTPSQIQTIAKLGQFYVQILPVTIATQYGMQMPTQPQDSPVRLAVPDPSGARKLHYIDPSDVNGIQFREHDGNFGQQLKGGPIPTSPVAVYAFHDIRLRPDSTGNVQFELNTGIERNDETDSPTEDMTDVQARLLDIDYKPVGQPVIVHPESLRTAYFQMPAAELNNGNFFIAIRSLSDDAWVGVKDDSLAAVVSSNAFVANLCKSLLILWMMSILVVTICIFCSTFLSWPIAIVLAIVLLLGRWGVLELGDATNSGIGNQVVADLGFTNPAQAKVVSTTVEGLTKMLNTVAVVLPDVSKFQATDDLQRGITLSSEQILEALAVLVGFGLPLLTLAYVFLKNKEVAP
jgi:hypothetical protein